MPTATCTPTPHSCAFECYDMKHICMCFSATASFTASGVLAAAGVATLAKNKRREDRLFASFPIIFAVQQAIEGVVWLTMGSVAINTAAAYAYVFFSHIFWPIFAPYAIYRIEKDPVRKTLLRLCIYAGSAIGLYLLYFVSTTPIYARLFDHGIAYPVPLEYPFASFFLYLVATCGSCILSSNRIINFFGVALFISFGISFFFFAAEAFSVWCFFAAILSVIIYWYVRSRA